MTSRERVQCALHHEQPDRVPIDFGGIVTSFTYGAYNRFVRHFGIREPKARIGGFKVMVDTDEEILSLLQADFRNIFFSPGGPRWQTTVHPDGTMTDVWGIRYCDVGDYYEMREFPLKDATVDDIETYRWPDFTDAGAYAGLRERAERLHRETSYSLVGTAAVNILERSQWLRGIGEFLVDMMVNEEFAVRLMDKMMELLKQFLDRYLEAVGPYIDVFCMGDDLASQGELLMSPELYRKFFKAPYKRVFDAVRKAVPGAKIWLHTCGSVRELIPDLIEAGVDVLNSLQPKAAGMDSAELKREFGGELVFHGGLDLQGGITGSVQEAVEEARRRIDAFAKGGGYIFAPSNHFMQDVPLENFYTVYRTAREYGVYRE